MPIPESEEKLTALFRELGASSPEIWARSQISEGIPQLLRFLFLKSAWKNIPGEGESAWIARAIDDAKSNPDRPYAGLGIALAHCKEKGVSDQNLTEIARCLRAQMLFHVCYLIDGPAHMPPALDDVSWGLFQVNEEGQPVGQQIAGLHESVLEFDPTDREMRPGK